jgi:hypothetical protein
LKIRRVIFDVAAVVSIAVVATGFSYYLARPNEPNPYADIRSIGGDGPICDRVGPIPSSLELRREKGTAETACAWGVSLVAISWCRNVIWKAQEEAREAECEAYWDAKGTDWLRPYGFEFKVK